MSYKIKVDDRHEFNITSKDLEKLDIISTSKDEYNFIHDHKSHNIKVIAISPRDKSITLKVDGKECSVVINDNLDQLISKLGLDVINEVNGQVIHSPMPGLVISIDVKVGDTVQEGDQLLVLEAMKMENVIKAVTDGVVKSVDVSPSEAVSKGQLLLEIEKSEE